MAATLFPGAAMAAAKYKLRVNGLACPFCAYGIEKKLKRAKGLKSLKININKGTIVVTMASGAVMSRAQAQRIVKDAGFTLSGFSKIK